MQRLVLAAGVTLAVGLCHGRPADAQQIAPAAEGQGAPKPKAKGSRKAAQKAGEKQPAAAAETVDAEATLDKAKQALAAGKPQVAQSLAETVLNSNTKDARNTARALAIRGEAHMKAGRSAEALADIENALWVKGGLAGPERDATTAARTQVLQQAGLDPGSAAAKASQRVEAPKTASAGSDSSSSGGLSGFGNFFGNLFGGSSQKSEPAPAATASLPPPAVAGPAVSASEPQRAEGVQARSTAQKSKPAAAAPVQASSAVVAPAAVAAGERSYRVQLGAVRSRAEATKMAERVKSEETSIVAGRTFDIDEAVYGNMGKFYRVRIGAFTSPVETQAVCQALRHKGIDCMALDN
ncbi:MAG: SPOR domain-containing protein [Proteobacteria bacterium]|nr:SPOR domain-containing protein [Pseudomonadota bacterium]